LEDLANLIKEQKIDLEDQDLQNILVKLSKNKIKKQPSEFYLLWFI
jgi:hypothetical protein